MGKLTKWRIIGAILMALLLIFAILSITPIFSPMVTESSASGFYGGGNSNGSLTLIEWLSQIFS
jgi:hypothetical protein